MQESAPKLRIPEEDPSVCNMPADISGDDRDRKCQPHRVEYREDDGEEDREVAFATHWLSIKDRKWWSELYDVRTEIAETYELLQHAFSLLKSGLCA